MFLEAFQIFKNKRYQNFWISNLGSNGAIWMQNMACAIILTHLSSSPFVNSMVQAATTLPLFLFGIFAGMAGDHFDKFRVLTISQLALSILAGCLAFFVYKGLMTPWLFIVITFLFASSTSFRMPTAQAGIAATVEPEQIKYAAIMNNLGYNLCRTFGPALAGLLIFYLPLYGVFCLSALMLFLVAVNFFFQSKKMTLKNTVKEPYRQCLKNIVKTKIFRDCGFDAFMIFFSGSLIWALMPYFARYDLHKGAGGQGALMAMAGIGALMTIIVLPAVIKLFTRQKTLLLCYAICLSALVMIRFSNEHNILVVGVSLTLFGLGWSMSVASLNGIIQENFQKSIATRAISLYLMLMYFAQFTGSLWAGYISSRFSIHAAMISSIILLAIGLLYRSHKLFKFNRNSGRACSG